LLQPKDKTLGTLYQTLLSKSLFEYYRKAVSFNIDCMSSGRLRGAFLSNRYAV
jgi:hypothetical protein